MIYSILEKLLLLKILFSSVLTDIGILFNRTFTGAKISNIPTGLCQEQKILRTL